MARAGSKVAALQTVLQRDRVLQDQAQSPLMLSIMTMAYSMAPEKLPKEVRDSEEPNTAHARQTLLDTYIERMFKRRSKSDVPYSKAQTVRWLSWLAMNMNRHNQAVFLIEGLQQSWLSTRWLRLFDSLSFAPS